jgi:hypothetical protein
MVRWTAAASGALDLRELAIPVVAVATSAAHGEPVYLASGLLARACVASGSVPPMAPSYVGGERLLDGCFASDVPAAVLSCSGATLRIGVAPVPEPRSEPWLPGPLVGGPWMQRALALQPALRAWDFARAFMMLFRQAARGGLVRADVVYAEQIPTQGVGLFWQIPRIVEEASRSPALHEALDEITRRWQSLRQPSRGRVRVDPRSGAIEVEHVRELLVARRAPGLAALGTFVAAQGLTLELHLREHDAELVARLREGLSRGLPDGELELRVVVRRELELETCLVVRRPDAEVWA